MEKDKTDEILNYLELKDKKREKEETIKAFILLIGIIIALIYTYFR